MKLIDYGSKGLPINQRDLNDDIRREWNNGLYELKCISTSQPNWTEDVSGIMVYSRYGGSSRLYISDISTANGWVYFDADGDL